MSTGMRWRPEDYVWAGLAAADRDLTLGHAYHIQILNSPDGSNADGSSSRDALGRRRRTT